MTSSLCSSLCFFGDSPSGDSSEGGKSVAVVGVFFLSVIWRTLLIVFYVMSLHPFSPRLSAFVLRCFLEADPYIDIDQNVLRRTYTWLKRHQKSNGEFWEPGRVIHSELQGGNKSPVTLTAYIVTSLVRYRKYQVFHL